MACRTSRDVAYSTNHLRSLPDQLCSTRSQALLCLKPTVRHTKEPLQSSPPQTSTAFDPAQFLSTIPKGHRRRRRTTAPTSRPIHPIPIGPSPTTAEANRPTISCLGASRTPQTNLRQRQRRASRPINLHKNRHSACLVTTRRFTTRPWLNANHIGKNRPNSSPPIRCSNPGVPGIAQGRPIVASSRRYGAKSSAPAAACST